MIINAVLKMRDDVEAQTLIHPIASQQNRLRLPQATMGYSEEVWYALNHFYVAKPCENIHFVAAPTILALSHFTRSWEPAEQSPEKFLA